MTTYELYRMAPWLMALAAAIGYAYTRRYPGRPAWTRVLEGPLGPLAAALLTAAAILFVTEGHAPTPVISDEASYRLQAELLAQGLWSAPSPPLPQFFEQMHVQVVPTVASKYFPGHALAIAPGVVLGSPWSMLLLMNAMAGALVFLLARRHFGIGVAVLAIALWVASGGNLRWRASWYSEITSSLLLLGAWWTAGLVKQRWSIATSIVLIAALALTRPLTAVAAAVPLAVVVLVRVVREQRLPEMAWGLTLGMALLGVLPWWAHATTGSWHETPQSGYTRDYMPWDRLGFGFDDTPPLRTPPPDQLTVAQDFHGLHQQHHASTYLPAVRDRMVESVRQAASGWRYPLSPLALLGIIAGGWIMAVPVATVLLQFAAYGFYAHGAGWSLYYLELFPVLAVLMAGGIGLMVSRLLRRVHPAADGTRWLLVVSAGAVFCALPDLRIQQARLRHHAGPTRAFAERLAQLPEPSLVFVRYAPDHFAHHALVTNLAPMDAQRVLVAYDRGAENALLRAHYPDRRAYLFDEADGDLSPLTPPDTAAGSATTPAGP
jgi:hypothetical protein